MRARARIPYEVRGSHLSRVKLVLFLFLSVSVPRVIGLPAIGKKRSRLPRGRPTASFPTRSVFLSFLEGKEGSRQSTPTEGDAWDSERHAGIQPLQSANRTTVLRPVQEGGMVGASRSGKRAGPFENRFLASRVAARISLRQSCAFATVTASRT